MQRSHINLDLADVHLAFLLNLIKSGDLEGREREGALHFWAPCLNQACKYLKESKDIQLTA